MVRQPIKSKTMSFDWVKFLERDHGLRQYFSAEGSVDVVRSFTDFNVAYL